MSDVEQVRGARWNRVGERGSAAGLRLMVWIFRLLGRRTALALLYPIIAYFFATGGGARRASLAYLRRVQDFGVACGAQVFARTPGLAHSFQHFLAFGEAIVDRISLWLGRTERCVTVWHGEDRKKFLELLAHNHGAVLLSAHFGNIEVLRALSRERAGIVVNALMYTLHAQRFNSVLREVNPSAAMRLVPLESISIDTAIVLRERLAAGEFVTMLADRVAAGAPERQVEVSFLGGTAAFPEGPFILASLLEAPVYTIFAVRRSDFTYEIFFDLLAERVSLPRAGRAEALRGYVEKFVHVLERRCLEAPYQWFNFYDFWLPHAAAGGGDVLLSGAVGAVESGPSRARSG